MDATLRSLGREVSNRQLSYFKSFATTMLPRMSLYLDLLSHLQVVVAIPRSGTARVFKCLNLNLNIKKYWVRNHRSFENFMQKYQFSLEKQTKQNKLRDDFAFSFQRKARRCHIKKTWQRGREQVQENCIRPSLPCVRECFDLVIIEEAASLFC